MSKIEVKGAELKSKIRGGNICQDHSTFEVFVETLDKCFKNVCELDIVFNYSKIHTILDEMIFGGQVLETSSTELVKAVEEISRLESASNSITLVPKSVSGWRNR
nr:ap-3 complex subunit sigma [Quercus suber]